MSRWLIAAALVLSSVLMGAETMVDTTLTTTLASTLTEGAGCTACDAWGTEANWTMAGYGDSLTEGVAGTPPTGEPDTWCDRIEQPRSCLMLGEGGRTMEAILGSNTATPADGGPPGVEYALAHPGAVFPTTTAYVSLFAGSNDLNDAGYDLDVDIMDRLEVSVPLLIAAGYRPVLWAPPPRWDGVGSTCTVPIEEPLSAARIAALQSALSALATLYDIPYFDGYAYLKTYGTDAVECTELYNTDKIHLNQNGQDLVARQVEALLDADWISRCTDDVLCALGNMGESGNTVVAEVPWCGTLSLPANSSCQDFSGRAGCAAAGITVAGVDRECNNNWDLMDAGDFTQFRMWLPGVSTTVKDAVWTFGSSVCTGTNDCQVGFKVRLDDPVAASTGTFRNLAGFIATDGSPGYAIDADVVAGASGAGTFRLNWGTPTDTVAGIIAETDERWVCLDITDAGANGTLTLYVDPGSDTPCQGTLGTASNTISYAEGFNKLWLRNGQHRFDDDVRDNLFACPGECFSLASNPVADFTARLAQGNGGDLIGVIPLAVHFDAIGDTTDETTDPDFDAFHACTFAWDFDDAGAGTWSTTGASKETDTGPIAVHVYETANTYNPTLTVTCPDGGSDVFTHPGIVANPIATEYAASEIYCASNDTDFTGSPCTGDNSVIVSTDAQAGRLWFNAGDDCGNGTTLTCPGGGSACDCPNADATTHRWVGMKGGDTFNFDVSVTPAASNTVATVITGYGPDGRAIQTGGGLSTLYRGVVQANIQQPSSIQGSGGSGGALLAGLNTVFNVKVTGSTCFGWASNSVPNDDRQIEIAVLADIDCDELTGSVPTVFYAGRYAALVGLDYDRNSQSGGIYTMRTKSLSHAVIAHSIWQHPSPGYENWTFRAEDDNLEYANGGAEADLAVAQEYWEHAYNVVRDNWNWHSADKNGFFTVRMCSDSGCNCAENVPQAGPVTAPYTSYQGCGTCGGSCEGTGRVVFMHHWIFEDNWFPIHSGTPAGTPENFFEVQGGSVTIRNNIIDFRGVRGSGGFNFRLVTMKGATDSVDGSAGVLAGTDLFVYNNTVIMDGAIDTNKEVIIGLDDESVNNSGCTANCKVRGNAVFWSDGAITTAPYTVVKDGGAEWTASDNPAIIDGTPNPFSTSLPAVGSAVVGSYDELEKTANPWVDTGYCFDAGVDFDSHVNADFYGTALVCPPQAGATQTVEP